MVKKDKAYKIWILNLHIRDCKMENSKLMSNSNNLKDIFQDCHINFLIGAGLSTPSISLLGNIEKLLTELSEKREKYDK